MDFTVATWNIAHASMTETLPPNANLDRITQHLAQENADFIMLNEVKNWDGPTGSLYGGVRQAQKIAQDLNMNYVCANVVATGLTGHMAVAVLSRYRLYGFSTTEVSPGYGFAEVFADVPHTTPICLYSVRFDHLSHEAEVLGKLSGHIRQLPAGTAAVVGGDFNTHRFNDEFVKLVGEAGLTPSTDFIPGSASNPARDTDVVDHILTRGPATMLSAVSESAPPNTSDHGAVTARVRLAATGVFMTVSPVTYSNERSPQEVYVEAYDEDRTQIHGDVLFDGQKVGTTFSSFSFKYKAVRRNVPAPEGGRIPTWLVYPPNAAVSADGFPRTQISFNLNPDE